MVVPTNCQGQHVVAALVDDLFGDVHLATHRIGGDGASFEVEKPQKLGNRRDLVRLLVCGDLRQNQPLLARPRADHVGVENRLHWVLDVDMNEDRARNRRDNGPQNLAILKHMAINKLNAEPSKLPIRRKLKKADRSDAFLRSLLAM
jgi:predicted transposase YbfD/YdcC